ncbi:MAG: hypothetical protein ACHQD8_06015 [Chitinophagales bacterium]
MKTLSRSSFCVAVTALSLSLLLCCSKKTFKSGIGLYSIKQYHCYTISSPGDTTKLADAHISTIAMNNNYLSWNGITFQMYSSNDSLATYINDSLVSGTTKTLYTLQYFSKTDKVVVVGNTTNKFWRSF